MTVIEIIEKSSSALIKQGCKSLRRPDSADCLYRGPNGTRCAIGWLIPDDKYLREFEDNAIEGLLESYEELSFLLPTDLDRAEGIEFLQELQSIHDGIFNTVDDWPPLFEQLTKKLVK